MYSIHYENVDPGKNAENLDPEKNEEKFSFENQKTLENMLSHENRQCHLVFPP